LPEIIKNILKSCSIHRIMIHHSYIVSYAHSAKHSKANA